ncbi:MAG: TfoX/Sxy family protein [Bacteroidia bacterium]|nr:TfoX/Sxy family protein [Bacteroidia bacterium]
MAYSEHLADRVRQGLSSQIEVEEKKMMGGLIFMVNGKMCVGVDIDKKTQKDRLMARIGKEAYAAALEEKGVREMDFTGTVMRGFVFIDPEGYDLDEDMDFWISKALEFNAQVKKK